jgi:hypothetical protein
MKEPSRAAEAGLSAQRIYQDLSVEGGFADSYQSVKRYVQKLKASEPRRIWRMESQPGDEAQVDFGLGAPIEIGPGKTRRSLVFQSARLPRRHAQAARDARS